MAPKDNISFDLGVLKVARKQLESEHILHEKFAAKIALYDLKLAGEASVHLPLNIKTSSLCKHILTT